MIDILLATYNGEKYLREQIDSLLNQTLQDFKIIVRDDGSSDNTLSILNDYKNKHNDKFILVNDKLGNLGSTKCFMSLLEYSKSEYIMFCDQDDVWLPTKVAISFNKIKALVKPQNYLKPLLVFTDLILSDQNLKKNSESLWKYQKLNPNIAKKWKYLVAQNVITGCTIIMNKAAKEASLPMPKELSKIMIHDQWIGINVSKYGEIDFINDATILYRQHSNNLEGGQNFNFNYILNKLKGVAEVLRYFKEMTKYFSEISFFNLFTYKIRLNLLRIFINSK